MVGKKEDFYEGVADKSELIQTTKGSIQEKWQKIYDTSTKTDLQEVISEVGKHQPNTGDREVVSTINQIITGQVALNYLKAKIDNTKSDKCDFCDKKRNNTALHFLSVKNTILIEKYWKEKKKEF